MIHGSCHCGAMRLTLTEPPTEVTSCNCSICRRLGTLWAYYPAHQVHIDGHPQCTQAYVQGDRTLRIVRCRDCGCTTHWEPLDLKADSRMGVNIRNFDPQWSSSVRMRMLDGADTWKSTFREPSPSGPF